MAYQADEVWKLKGPKYLVIQGAGSCLYKLIGKIMEESGEPGADSTEGDK